MWLRSRSALLAFFLALPLLAQGATSCNGGNLSLSLGTYNAYQTTPLDSSGVYVVRCTRSGGGARDTLVTIGLGPSSTSGTIATRRLKRTTGTDLLAYNFFRDAARAALWGETIGTNTFSQSISLDNNTSGNLTFTFFARIDARQDVRAGSYRDSLTITVNF
jgi:spore coat protein U-like protein